MVWLWVRWSKVLGVTLGLEYRFLGFCGMWFCGLVGLDVEPGGFSEFWLLLVFLMLECFLDVLAACGVGII